MTTGHNVFEDAWVEEIRQYHPQLTEKALIDFANGLEVVKDHLRCRQKEKPLFARLWRSVTGQTLREQYIININLKTGLSAVKQWLEDIQMFQASSDLALAVVSEKLVETRAALDEEITEVVSVIDSTLQGFNAQLCEVKLRIHELEMRDKARNHLEMVIVRGREYTHRNLPPLAQAFIEIDELWWGDFGAYCRMTAHDEVKGQFVRIAHSKISELFAQRMDFPTHELLSVEDLLKPLLKLDENEGALIAYLADYGTSERIPLMRTMAKATIGCLDMQSAPHTLPLALSPYGITQRLLHESRLATSEIKR